MSPSFCCFLMIFDAVRGERKSSGHFRACRPWVYHDLVVVFFQVIYVVYSRVYGV